MVDLPERFKEEMRALLGEESEGLFAALNDKPLTSVRINRRKPVADFGNEEPVPWCKSGFYLAQRPEFIFDPLLHAGAYYVQDASSMIYEPLTEKLLQELNFTDEDKDRKSSKTSFLRVLDLCAAPGGKTTAMINALPDGCEVVANEYVKKRLGALQENIDRWGYPSVTVTNKDSTYFAQQGETFDIIAVDAPCSGEGMMRKEEVSRTQWCPQLVSQCAQLQKEILKNANEALKPGGFLVYSTCTFNRKENEENAQYIKEELGLIPFNPEFPDDWNIQNGIGTEIPVFRFMPHKTKGEGLFLAVFRKPGEWIPSRPTGLLSKKNSKQFRNKVSSETEVEYPRVDVDKSTAISYLKGESIILPENSPKGMVLITYKGLALGEAKNIGARANNHYPKNRRILKR